MEKESNSTMEPIREYFPFYYSFTDALQELDERDRLAIYDGITNYAFFGTEPDLKSVVARACWKLIKPLLEKSQRNYKNGSKGGAPKGSRNNPNGRRGKSEETNQELTENLPKTNQELTENLPKTNQELRYKDNDKDKEKENDNESESVIIVSDEPKPRTKSSRMSIPSVEEIAAYMMEKGEPNPQDEAQAFFDYFDSKGWVVGKAPMKRWRSAVGTWLRNKYNGYGRNQQNNTKPSQADNIARAQQFAFTEMANTAI